jgi:hypothetical protein
MAILQPSCARRIAIACPIPELAPVIKAFLPFNPFIAFSPQARLCFLIYRVHNKNDQKMTRAIAINEYFFRIFFHHLCRKIEQNLATKLIGSKQKKIR